MPTRSRLLVWADARQAPIVRDAIRAADADLVAVGAATADGAAALADELDIEAFDDLRAAIHREDADLLWLLAPEHVESDVLRLIRDLRLRAITSQPRPLSVSALAAEPSDVPVARFVPLMRHGAGYRRALDVLEHLGEVQGLNVCVTCGPTEGSLAARLFDAMDLVSALCGDARSISAALAPSPATPPETLEQLHGHLTLNVRFADQRVAAVTASDRGGGWCRHVTILGTHGRLWFSDDELTWVSADGTTLDRHTEAELSSPGTLVGRQIRRIIDEQDSTDPRPSPARLLAYCEAARLSCRTGGEESPGRVLEVLSRP